VFVQLEKFTPEIFTYRMAAVHIPATMPLKFLILMAAMKPHGLILATLAKPIWSGERKLQLVQNLHG
jgi:hypothetical protein